MTGTDDSLPNDVAMLKAMLLAERAARTAMQAEAQARMLEIEKLKFTIARLRHERFGAASERAARLIDQLELQLADLEETAAESEVVAEAARVPAVEVHGFTRRRPARRPLPDHLPRERIVYPAPSACDLHRRRQHWRPSLRRPLPITALKIRCESHCSDRRTFDRVPSRREQ